MTEKYRKELHLKLPINKRLIKRQSIKVTMKKKNRFIYSLVPKGTKLLYTANSNATRSETEFLNLSESDLNLYLSILQTQGIS